MVTLTQRIPLDLESSRGVCNVGRLCLTAAHVLKSASDLGISDPGTLQVVPVSRADSLCRPRVDEDRGTEETDHEVSDHAESHRGACSLGSARSLSGAPILNQTTRLTVRAHVPRPFVSPLPSKTLHRCDLCSDALVCYWSDADSWIRSSLAFPCPCDILEPCRFGVNSIDGTSTQRGSGMPIYGVGPRHGRRSNGLA